MYERMNEREPRSHMIMLAAITRCTDRRSHTHTHPHKRHTGIRTSNEWRKKQNRLTNEFVHFSRSHSVAYMPVKRQRVR